MITLTVLASFSLGLSGFDRPNMTEAQVARRAEAFVKAIGLKVTGKPAVRFGASSASPGGPETHWEKRWYVYYPDEAELHVVDRTTTVSWFDNLALGNRMRKMGRNAPGE